MVAVETLVTEKFFPWKVLIKFSEIYELVLPLSTNAKGGNEFELLQRILTGTTCTGKKTLIKESEPTNTLETLAIVVVFSPLSLSVGVVLRLLKLGGVRKSGVALITILF